MNLSPMYPKVVFRLYNDCRLLCELKANILNLLKIFYKQTIVILYNLQSFPNHYTVLPFLLLIKQNVHTLKWKLIKIAYLNHHNIPLHFHIAYFQNLYSLRDFPYFYLSLNALFKPLTMFSYRLQKVFTSFNISFLLHYTSIYIFINSIFCLQKIV